MKNCIVGVLLKCPIVSFSITSSTPALSDYPRFLVVSHESKRIIKNLYLHHILKTAMAGFRPLSYLLPASPILERFHGPVIMCEYIYIFYIYMNTCIRGGTNIQSDPDTSDNRCSKPDPRYLTRLSAKVLISRITVYSILTGKSSWCHISENCCPIDRLATTLHIFLNKTTSGKLDPDPVLISAYVPLPDPI